MESVLIAGIVAAAAGFAAGWKGRGWREAGPAEASAAKLTELSGENLKLKAASLVAQRERDEERGRWAEDLVRRNQQTAEHMSQIVELQKVVTDVASKDPALARDVVRRVLGYGGVAGDPVTKG